MPREYIPGQLVFDYELYRPTAAAPARELLVLLHGYNESGTKMLARVLPHLPEIFLRDRLILAPNGPYPMPARTEQGYRVGYSWYFYDPSTQEYFIDMRIALGYLDEGLRRLDLLALPLRVIGFSQGGYLAPIAALQWPGARQVIGIGCEYLVDGFPRKPSLHPSFRPSFRIDALHGVDDEIVPLAQARDTHARLGKAGIAGDFQAIAQSGHRIDAAIGAALSALLLRPL